MKKRYFYFIFFCILHSSPLNNIDKKEELSPKDFYMIRLLAQMEKAILRSNAAVKNVGIWLAISANALLFYSLLYRPIKNFFESRKTKRNDVAHEPFSSIAINQDTFNQLKRTIALIQRARTKGDIRAIKGILLHGPTGTGKTLLAQEIAYACNMPIMVVSGSEILNAKYIGHGAAKIRECFNTLKSLGGGVLVIDEIAGFKRRLSGAESALESDVTFSLNELLTQIDGLEKDPKNFVVVIMTTNSKPEDFDSALMRPGRIEQAIKIDLPDDRTRLAILNIYLKKYSQLNNFVCSDEFIKAFLAQTKGFNGAEIEKVINDVLGDILLAENEAFYNSQRIEQLFYKTLARAGKKRLFLN